MDLQNQIESDISLYNKLIPFVWLIEIYSKSAGSKKEKILETISGFGVHKSNLIATCFYTSVGPISNDGLCIRARRLTIDDDFTECVIKQEFPRVDLAVLLVQKLEGDDNVLKFGDGILEVGERVLHLGNPVGFEGSFLTGEVAYRCRNVEYKSSKETCDHYQNPIIDNKNSDYRILGNYYNVRWFKNSVNRSTANYEKLKGLHPKIPIVQINGMMVKAGCYGGPLFNGRGELVGIMYGGVFGYATAIHVSVLKRVEVSMRKLLEKEELEKAVKKRDMPVMDEGTSKKTKV